MQAPVILELWTIPLVLHICCNEISCEVGSVTPILQMEKWSLEGTLSQAKGTLIPVTKRVRI